MVHAFVNGTHHLILFVLAMLARWMNCCRTCQLYQSLFDLCGSFVWGKTHKFWWRFFNGLAFCCTWMSPTAKGGIASCLKHPRKIWEHYGPLSYSFYSLSSSHYLRQLLQRTPFLFKLFSLERRTKIYFIFKIQLMCKNNSKSNIVYDFHIIICLSPNN
jgi:hypothetical protein